nr:MAG TPA: hypothetical protein [Crassvirales sp.]
MIKKIQKEYLEEDYAICIVKLIIFGITVYVNKTYTTNKNIISSLTKLKTKTIGFNNETKD